MGKSSQFFVSTLFPPPLPNHHTCELFVFLSNNIFSLRKKGLEICNGSFQFGCGARLPRGIFFWGRNYVSTEMEIFLERLNGKCMTGKMKREKNNSISHFSFDSGSIERFITPVTFSKTLRLKKHKFGRTQINLYKIGWKN